MSHQNILASRLGVVAKADAFSFIRNAIPVIADWIAELAVNALPPRDVVVAWADEAIAGILASTDFPVVNDVVFDPIAQRALSALAGKLYDSIVSRPPVI